MTSASSRYDVIVAGVGGMGSATAYHLAHRGRKVLGLERYDVPHEMGSSHGITRIIRLAYYEHPSYVPLLRRAYEADKLVLAAGAWVSRLATPLAGLAVPERQVLGWFQPRRPDLFLPERFPVFNLLVEEGRYYGLPIYGVPGFKLGRYHHRQEQVDPDRMDRQAGPDDERVLRAFTERYFPDAAGPTMALRVCLFTNTPDEHFVLDLHPEYPQVCIASPCSGHGFKFCSVVGEIMADLAECGQTRHDIAMFRLSRLRPLEENPEKSAS